MAGVNNSDRLGRGRGRAREQRGRRYRPHFPTLLRHSRSAIQSGPVHQLIARRPTVGRRQADGRSPAGGTGRRAENRPAHRRDRHGPRAAELDDDRGGAPEDHRRLRKQRPRRRLAHHQLSDRAGGRAAGRRAARRPGRAAPGDDRRPGRVRAGVDRGRARAQPARAHRIPGRAGGFGRSRLPERRGSSARGRPGEPPRPRVRHARRGARLGSRDRPDRWRARDPVWRLAGDVRREHPDRARRAHPHPPGRPVDAKG